MHHKHLVILNSSLARCPYSTKRYMIHLIYFEREERRSYAGASGQVSHHCSLHSLPGWLDVTVALIYCWFISSSYDFSLFSVFFLPQNYPSKLQHHWIKYHLVDLPSLKAINFYWSFIYLFDIYFIATTEPDQDMERTSVQHGQEFLHSEWNILCGLP